MKPLRQKMIRAMELRNLAKGTQRNYLLSVIGATRYYQKPPDTLSKEMIEDYLLYLKNGKGNTPGSCSVAASGLRFFYNYVADKNIPIDYRFSKKCTTLPTVLTPEEVLRLIHTPKNLKTA
jgi:site-specific recombinase XerD